MKHVWTKINGGPKKILGLKRAPVEKNWVEKRKQDYGGQSLSNWPPTEAEDWKENFLGYPEKGGGRGKEKQ